MTVKHIPIGNINVYKNIRRDDDEDISGLMESIERHDILQPILVVPEKSGKYRLIAGHRRYRAVKASGEPFIPALIRDDINESMIPIIQLSENVQRKQMKPWELVAVFEDLKKTDPKMTHSRIAHLLGKSPAWVSLKYRAAKVFDKLVQGGIPEEELCDLSENVLLKIDVKRQYNKSGKHKNQGRRPYEYRGGFELVHMGPKKMMLLFKDEEKVKRVEEILESIRKQGGGA